MPEERASSHQISMTSGDAAIEAFFGVDLADAAGEYVTHDRALGVSAIWRAVNLVSSTIGKLPMLAYRRTMQPSGLIGRELMIDTPTAKMLGLRPNPEMSAATFWSTLTANVLQWGNGLAEIERSRSGRPVNLWPIHWSRVDVTRLNGRVVYKIRDDNGDYTVLNSDDVLHVPGLSFNGTTGLSVIQYARASMGLTVAAEKYGARFFANSGRPSGVIKHPMKLTPEASMRLRETWAKNYSGHGAQGTAVLEEGMDYKPIGMPPEDAQFIQTRAVQVLEVARWYGVPPHMLYQMDKATFNNIEHQSASFRDETIDSLATRIEQEVDYKIMSSSEFARFDRDRIVIPGLLERSDAYSKQRMAGLINADEARAAEGRSPIPGGAGQAYWQPVNVYVVGEGGEPLPPPSQSGSLPAVSPDDENNIRDNDGGSAGHTVSSSVGLACLSPVFADVAERMTLRETHAKARCKAQDRAAWLASWSAKHRDWVADQLLPVIRSALVIQGIEDRDGYADDLAKGIAAEWCDGMTFEPRTGGSLEKAIAAAMQAVKVES